METVTIPHRQYLIMEWNIHCARAVVEDIKKTVEACAQPRPSKYGRFDEVLEWGEPLGIDSAKSGVNQLVRDWKFAVAH